MKKNIYIGIITLVFALIPNLVSADTAVPAGQSEFGATTSVPSYVLLTPLPCVGVTNGSNGTNCTNVNGSSQITSIGLQGYLIYLYRLLIAFSVFLTVVMVIFGGFKYMAVESVGGKAEAKETIENALKGLFLALASYLILYTINPNLVNISKVAIPKLNVAASSTVQKNIGDLSAAPVQTMIASDAALTSQKSAITQAQSALQTAQNLDNQIQNQLDDCESGAVDCSVTQYESLQSQLTTVQQAETLANNQLITQTALAGINTQVVQGSGILSTNQNAPATETNTNAVTDIATRQTSLQSTYNSALSTLTANGNNDPADVQTLNDTYEFASSTLADEQALLQAQANPQIATTYLQMVNQEDAVMANNGSTTLQQQYQTQSTATKAAIQAIVNNQKSSGGILQNAATTGQFH